MSAGVPAPSGSPRARPSSRYVPSPKPPTSDSPSASRSTSAEGCSSQTCQLGSTEMRASSPSAIGTVRVPMVDLLLANGLAQGGDQRLGVDGGLIGQFERGELD